MSYSEKQLLLLSNFVYLPCSVNDGSISDIIDGFRDANGNFTPESVQGAGTGGGLSIQDVCTLFEEFDQEIQENPDFGEISAARKLNAGNVRAICYTDGNDEDPLLVFRGTGGSEEAWTDNFEGEYESDTQMQSLAADFVKNECSAYSNITVTGHSKGGNLSQYVTVTCGDMITACVSFDGQGFNNEFINNNKEQVEAAAPKIKSVAAHNDFVNILLTPIAGEIMYVDNANTLAAAHSSLSMLVSNEYDENGNIITSRDQSTAMSCLKKVTDNLVSVIDDMDIKDKKTFSNITGSTVATALEIGGISDAVNTVAELSQKVSAVFVSKLMDAGIININNGVSLVTSSLYVDTAVIKNSAIMLSDIRGFLRRYSNEITELENNIAYSIASQLYVRRKLLSISDDLNKLEKNITMLVNSMETIALRYENREMNLVTTINQASAT